MMVLSSFAERKKALLYSSFVENYKNFVELSRITSPFFTIVNRTVDTRGIIPADYIL